MLSRRLEVIKSLLNGDEEKAKKIDVQIDNLMSSDVITATLLSRKQKITIDQSNLILKFLVDEGILRFFIVVECINPDNEKINEVHHFKYFNSLGELNSFIKDNQCKLCGCGYSYDINNAKIGFRKVIS